MQVDILDYTAMEQLLPVIISLISLGYIIYATRKLNVEKMYSFLRNKIKQDAEEWLNSETGHKALLSLGALIGAGARQGAGFGISKGKGGFEGMIAQLLGNLLGARTQSEQDTGIFKYPQQ